MIKKKGINYQYLGKAKTLKMYIKGITKEL